MQGHYYMDLKPGQILYIKNKGSQLGVELFVGDLGSLINGKKMYPKYHIHSYPHPKYYRGNLVANMMTMDWVLGSFLFLLAAKTSYTDDLHYSSPKLKTLLDRLDVLEKRIDNTFTITNKYAKLLNYECKRLLILPNVISKV